MAGPKWAQLQPTVQVNEQNPGTSAERDGGKANVSRSQSSQTLRQVPLCVTSSSTVTKPNLVYTTYANATSQAGFTRPTANTAVTTAGQHGPAFGPPNVQSQPRNYQVPNQYQPDARWNTHATEAPSQHGPAPVETQFYNYPASQTAPDHRFFQPTGAVTATTATYHPDACLFVSSQFDYNSRATVTKPPKSHTCGNAMERLSHLRSFLVPELPCIIGESLGNPGLYPKTLRELQEMFGNPRAIAAAYSTDMKNLPSFKDGDPLALRLFSMTLRSIVSTLEIGGYGGELYANSTLQELEEKLSQILCDKWADYSSRIKHRLPNIMDFNAWIIEDTKA